MKKRRSFIEALHAFVFGRREADPPTTFAVVREDEGQQIVESRKHRYEAADPRRSDNDTYIGLALSGGGIRSATFSLGVLQGMQRLGVLRVVDYLSTVSGGGYTGGWWSAWLNRGSATTGYFPPDEGLEPERVVTAATPGDGARFAGADPVHHLRLFANYLTPRKGLLSADTWGAAAVVSRNLILTWLVLLPIACMAALAGHLYYIAQPFDDTVVEDFVHRSLNQGSDNADLHDMLEPDEYVRRAKAAAPPLAAMLALLVWVTALWMHNNNAGTRITHVVNVTALCVLAVAAWAASGSGFVWRPAGGKWISAHLWTAALAVATFLALVMITKHVFGEARAMDAVVRQARANRATQWHAKILVCLVGTTLVLAFAGFAHELLIRGFEELSELHFATWSAGFTALGALLGVVSTIYTAFISTPAGGRDQRDVGRPSALSRIVLAITPPVVLVLLAGAASLLMHRTFVYVSVQEGRVTALLVGAGVGAALTVFLAWWENRQVVDGERVPTAYVFAAFVLFAVAVTLEVVSSGRRPRMPVAPQVLGLALAGVALVGLWHLRGRNMRVRWLLGGTFAIHALWMVITLPGFDAVWANDPPGWRAEPLRTGLAMFAALGGWVLALGWMADPNAVSLHTFYRVRLVRAYLGASNPGRRQRGHDIAEADSADDLPLSLLSSARLGGPYHLINTTLNLVGGRDLVTAQRFAANFILSSRFCGSTRTGYRSTAKYMHGCLTLGAAIATSGAAVSPNMGSATPSAALALMLAAMNIRLGLWVPTPEGSNWRTPQAHLWPVYLLRESLSQTNELGSYCYLTDGGHFDNTGLYALVERGCRFMVICDNGADPSPSCFADIGRAIRRCRIDFRAEIDLDTRLFRPTSGPGSVHIATGTIRYDIEHVRGLGWSAQAQQNLTGKIVWIKPTLLAGDAADVRQYGLENAQFPQQTTLDQWFDEGQFESYRKLGEVSAEAAFGKAAAMLAHAGDLTVGRVEKVFENI
jgi:hypothetical protein